MIKLSGVTPIIEIDREASVPLQTQIYAALRKAILRGDLRPGQKVPSTRELTSEIHVSRFPVLHAYDQLLAEGYLVGRVGSGTFVSNSLPDQLMSVSRHVSSSAHASSGPRPLARRAFIPPLFTASPARRGWGAFGVHQPAFDAFPFHIWSSLLARHSQNPNATSFHHIDPLGSERFRNAICAYLRTARAVNCEPSQIMVVSGSQQALDITARVLFDPGSGVYVEEPGYRLARAILASAGCRLIPTQVDSDGMAIREKGTPRRDVRAALVTPSHQYPLGSTMSASRRLHLLNWAQRSGAWIIEDDYDSGYRFDSQPIASLQGLDVNSRVIYIGTFSKVLFPSLRVGYLVIPKDLVARFVAMRFAMDIFPQYLFQEVLADFMEMGHFGQHLRKMRQLYRERRCALVESLEQEFKGELEIHGENAGMHLAVTLPKGINDEEVVARASLEKLWLAPLSSTYFGRKVRHGLILGFGSTPAAQIPRAVRHLHRILQL
jgi:GntR family transcriptional regulator/MocR family aminotransferase